MKSFHDQRGRAEHGFSLVEILLAIGILGIGLIMVATVFPVGAEWTRRGVNDSVAQVVAQNALVILQTHFPFGGSNAPNVTVASDPHYVPPGTLTLFPGLNAEIPPSGSSSERCYNYGASNPCPADSSKASYFWTALIRTSLQNPPNPDPPSVTRKYDVYILVFKKGDINQTFTPSVIPTQVSQFAQFIDTHGDSAMGVDTTLPTLAISNNALGQGNGKIVGVYNPTSGTWTTLPVPRVGEYGIGATSGTAFRQAVKTTYASNANSVAGAAPQPAIASSEKVIIAPPADGATASPLVYIFQTTLAY